MPHLPGNSSSKQPEIYFQGPIDIDLQVQRSWRFCFSQHRRRHKLTLKSKATLIFISSQVGPALVPTFQSLTHLPVMCIVSKDDPFGNTTGSMESVCAASEHSDSHLRVYEGDAHGTPLFEQDPALVSNLVAWFRIHLDG